MKKKSSRDIRFDNDTIENFGFIPGIPGVSQLLDVIIKIFEFIGKILIMLAMVLVKLFTLIFNPFQAVVFLCQIIFAMFLMVFYLLWMIGVKYIFLVILLIITSLFDLVMFVIVCIFIAIFMLFDAIIFRGWFYPLYYRSFGASENQPNAWYENGSYQRHNRTDGNFFKCGDNYVPDSGNMFFCTRLNRHEPRFCPTPALYRLYKGQGIKDVLFGKDFHPSANLMKNNINGRNVDITNFILNKLSYLDLCNTYSNQYNPVTKQICKSIDLIVDKTNRNRMSNICHEQYCTNGERESFCNKLDGNNMVKNVVPEQESSESNMSSYEKLYFNAVYLFILITIISIIMKRNLK